MEGHTAYVVRTYVKRRCAGPRVGRPIRERSGHRANWKYSDTLDQLLDMERLLAKLPPQCCIALTLAHGAGWPVREIAIVTGRSVRAVARDLHQAEERFEALYRAYEAGNAMPHQPGNTGPVNASIA